MVEEKGTDSGADGLGIRGVWLDTGNETEDRISDVVDFRSGQNAGIY